MRNILLFEFEEKESKSKREMVREGGRERRHTAGGGDSGVFGGS